MKKLAIAVALFGAISTAQAAGLSVSTAGGHAGAIGFSGYDGEPVGFTGNQNSGVLGALFADVAGTISFTYLGQESGHVNQFNLVLGAALFEGGTAGSTTVSSFINSGLVDFKFIDTNPNPDVAFANGAVSTSQLGFAILSATNSPYLYYIGFNDTFDKDADYDDFVVGVNFSPVPVPAALPLMATALGLFGFGASRGRI
ncbi:MAG: hypothetical protein V4605_02470 [Pseudomonadota bacterium]